MPEPCPEIYKVVMMRDAVADLSEIRQHISDQADSKVADKYTHRIEAFCRGFDILPQRGTPRNDIRQGLRIAIFESRVTIAYRVDGLRVIILRILGYGRDVQTDLFD